MSRMTRSPTGIRSTCQHVRPVLESLETRTLLSAARADSSGPIVDNNGQVPFQLQLTPLTVPNAPGLQAAASAEFDGKWLFIGGRTNGQHSFSFIYNNFPPASQNTNIYVIDPKTGQVWSRAWSDSTLSQAVIEPLTATATESEQLGNHLYMIGGYGYVSALGYDTTFDTLTSINVPGMIQAVIHGGNLAAQIQQIHKPVLQVTGGQLGTLNSRQYLVMGQSFVGDYTPNPLSYTQTYTDQIQSFQIVDTANSLAIRKYRTITDVTNFHRRDFRMSPVILPDGRPGIEAYGGVFTSLFGAYRQPITIVARDGPPSRPINNISASTTARRSPFIAPRARRCRPSSWAASAITIMTRPKRRPSTTAACSRTSIRSPTWFSPPTEPTRSMSCQRRYPICSGPRPSGCRRNRLLAILTA